MRKMVVFICLLVVAVGLYFGLSSSANAASESDLTFTLNSDGVSYSVTDCGMFASGALSIPATYNGYPVTSIGEHAFSLCYSLTSVHIPNSVTSIGKYAFMFCFKLTSVHIPNSVTSIGDEAFSSCSSLTSVHIPNSVTSIGDEAFYSCSSLTSVSIPNSVTSIGMNPFTSCSKLESITVDEGNTKYYSEGNCVIDKASKELVIGIKTSVIPNDVTSIGDEAFYYCSSLTSVSIPNGVTSIGKYAFYYCSSLTSVHIPNSVTSIGAFAFDGCSGLTSVSIPNSVTSIGAYAFNGCSGLTSVSIPNSVTSIGMNSFASCSKLESITVDEGNTKYYSEGNCVINKASKELVIGIKTSVIPNDIISIGDRAFYGCYLTSVSIPNGVTSIGKYAFCSCSSLTSVHIPNSVTSIGNDAFNGCSGLTSVSIPNSVTSIGMKSFASCSKLESITVDEGNSKYYSEGNCVINKASKELVIGIKTSVIPNDVTSIGAYAFNGCSGLTSVTIPQSVTRIGSYAFYDCSSLASITIPNTIANINSSVFSGCQSLKDIWYLGGETEKQLIAISSGNDILLSATWHYNACPIGAEHTYDSDCDEQCNTCTELRAVDSEHTYTDVCDATCNACGTERAAPHDYDSDCDEQCNTCTELRAVDSEHTYTDVCDATCNACGTERAAPHNYQWIVDLGAACDTTGTKHQECRNCHATQNQETIIPALGHTYDSDCDEQCNTCTELRVVDSEHTYTDVCDATCNACGTERAAPHNYQWIVDLGAACDTTGTKHQECRNCHATQNQETIIPALGHTYDSDCDEQCNTCIELRAVDSEHTYTGVCDATCNACGTERAAPHDYDSDCDTQCNLCEAVRTASAMHVKKSYTVTNSTEYPFVLAEGVYTSANKAHNSTATFTINVKVDRLFDIQYYTSTEANYDSLIINHNGTQKVKASGSASWKTITLSALAGDVITISYKKDSSVSSGNDAVYFQLPDIYTYADQLTPTCTESVICDYCGETVKDALGHTYDSDCDEQCNTCTELRAVDSEHTYTDVCDATCNVCGTERAVSHDYDSDCDEQCNMCTELRVVDSEHTYTDACDATCNACGAERAAPHDYEWVIEKQNSCGEDGVKHEECSLCHTKRNENTKIPATGEHSFSDDVDEQCDVCKKTFYHIVLISYDGNSYKKTRVSPEQTYTIPSAGPTRSGYNFKGWATTKSGEVEFSPMDSFAVSRSVTLYAQWNKVCPVYEYDPCNQCSGRGKVQELIECWKCYGKGDVNYSVSCSSCSGAGTIKKTCSACGGDGETYEICFTCTERNGNLVYASNGCVLLGHYMNGDRCSNCSGGGKVYIKCSNCGGNGLIRRSKECSTCNGKGEVLGDVECTNCAGEGRFPKTCSKCNGSGEVIRQSVAAPGAPSVESVNSSTVVLQIILNGEYSIDGITWQDSPIFENLTNGEEYYFYQRYAKTDTEYASASSAPRIVIVHSHTYDNDCDSICNICSDVRVVSEHEFDNVCDEACNVCGQTRIAAHSYTLNGNHTCDLCKYSKTPDAPMLVSKTHDSVILTSIGGFEYSADGVVWQSSNVFTNLKADTTYTFYQRVKASNIALVSETSAAFTVKTEEEPIYTVKFVDWDGMIISIETYHWGDVVTAPADPVRVADETYAYVFTGWDKAVVNCAGDANYVAIYEQRAILRITTQPKNVSVANGATAKVTVGATGDGLKYTWYIKNAGGSKFSKSSITKSTYSVAMSDKADGRQVYCVITDQYGNSVTTDTVTLSMKAELKITTQPKDVCVANGETATVKFTAVGEGLTYKWYYKDAGASSYKLTTTFKGNTYTTTMTDARAGRRVLCKVYDKYGNMVKTKSVLLSQAVRITKQPADVCVANGETVTIKVVAKGEGLTYKWYYKDAGASSYKLTTSFTGNTYTTTMNDARAGRRVLCKVYDKYGNMVQSNSVVMNQAVRITKQPANVTVANGATAKVTVTAKGEGLTYSWFFMNPGESDFTYTGSFTGKTYSVKMNASRAGRQVCCVITDKFGNSVQSNIVTLRMK